MGRFQNELLAVSAFAQPKDLVDFQRHIEPGLIDEALAASGVASIRRRRLPAEQVSWLVIGMGLFSNLPITEVASKLNLVLPGARGPKAAPSAISKARSRLGKLPIKWLFEKCAKAWADASADRHKWRELAVYGVDGTTLRLPDSAENRSHFGGVEFEEGSQSGYPVARLVGLMALRSHMLRAVSFGPYKNGEHFYAKNLWKEVPDNSLTIVDKGFFSADVLESLSKQGNNRHWLIRAKKNTKMQVIRKLGPNDYIVEMAVSGQAHKINPSLGKTWTARAVHYQIEGNEPQILLTSLLDAALYPRKEIAALYHERWEIELGYDEIKTEMLEGLETLRSQKVEGIEQEIWGIVLSYNLIRLEIATIADEAKIVPTRISFVMAMRFIQDIWSWCAIVEPGNIPRHLKRLRTNVKDFILPERRPKRRYPRAVKVARSRYPSKQQLVRKGAVSELK